ncbi:DUF2934 domain-containing protein [Pseudomonas sp. 10S4]|uniref:DUF2934 domain-containing protein n=1 Tax=Pseudomonas sp. 10S4 TaxID=3048583 RepID=UPI002AC8E7A9|nr:MULTISPECIES: DUF2934 domain-containing protein [unclassified Pseudomonas]MEB0222937.1 DUF2934 domain-containing protein [Pseudomonas sp. 5S1]MEB0293019.1 DUF2934 domain-containing protein [Pseudomonas sp. 10S4]WPX17239.1 DUF2934 domain-containing protein [Pseudomonas sp. 10S4]
MIDDSAIRERAYALWEKDACPEGAAKFYWHLAREQLLTQVQAQESDARNLAFDNVKSDVLDTFAFST